MASTLADPDNGRAASETAPVRVAVVTLGCDKNTVDSERTMASLVAAGAAVTSGTDGADVVVVNTCGFIEAAKQESVDAILEVARLKQEGSVGAVVAMGCLVQRYKAELQAELPEVDLFLGVSEAGRLLPELQARGLLSELGARWPLAEPETGAQPVEPGVHVPGRELEPDRPLRRPGTRKPVAAPERQAPEAPRRAPALALGRAPSQRQTAGLPSELGTSAAAPTMERPLRVLMSDTPHSSFLKVSEGCDHSCAFCAIPLMRGKHRSMPIGRLVREAQQLEARGVVELNLVSQDTTWYGRDLVRPGAVAAADDDGLFMGRPFDGMAGPWPGRDGLAEPYVGDSASSHLGGQAVRLGDGARQANVIDARRASASAVAGGIGLRTGRGRAAAGEIRSGNRSRAGSGNGSRKRRTTNQRGDRTTERRAGLLPDLLATLLAETSMPWFRLFYMYPSGIRRELVELLAREDRILPYLDMPIQHGADTVLERMRRPERQAVIRERVGWLRSAIPDVVLRTTVIVGFPGETEEEFEMLLDLLEEVRFDRVGAFAYSHEEGTRAAAMPDPVPEAIKRERLERLLDLQRSISLEQGEAQVGREVVVLVDRRATGDEPCDAVGRTPGQAREVDGVVLLSSPSNHTNAAPRPGTFVRARITGASELDLMAEVLDE